MYTDHPLQLIEISAQEDSIDATSQVRTSTQGSAVVRAMPALLTPHQHSAHSDTMLQTIPLRDLNPKQQLEFGTFQGLSVVFRR
jgi:hypothetical protein